MPVLYYTILAFHEHQNIKDITLVVSKKNLRSIKDLVKKYRFPRITKIVLGGKTRQQSLKQGLLHLQNPKQDDLILVHNGANPLVTSEEISNVISAAKNSGAAAVGRKTTDTIKEIKNNHYHKTHDREKIINMQTPQVGKYGDLIKALKKAKKEYTDETCLLESIDIKVKHVEADPNNFKITTQHDLDRAKMILGDTPKNFLVGLGQDSHEFSQTKKGLHLCGVLLKNEQKLEADSDGDVVLHALANACSQAIGEGSLGRFATPLYKEEGIKNSARYLEKVLAAIHKKNYRLNNIGIMIEGARPAIDPLVPEMKKNLTRLTKLPSTRIGITATSGKNLTSFGKGLGIQCFAIVSLQKDES